MAPLLPLPKLTDLLPRYEGRAFPTPPCPSRTPFSRDRDRLIHSKAFRRLQHKTQAFVEHEGDHYRSRLTHSLEVAQVARAISRNLNLDQDLTEALALGHDFGHPPFGHAGERALQRLMQGQGGFDHNYQSLRIITGLERRYPDFDGLNLTFATLEGLVKHNGAMTRDQFSSLCHYVDFSPFTSAELWPYQADKPAFPEAAVAAIADDIAYNVHDLDDGLRSRMINWSDLESLPLTRDLKADIHQTWPHLEQSRAVSELTRRLLTKLIDDVCCETRQALIKAHEKKDTRHFYATFSPDVGEAVKGLKAMLFTLIYKAGDMVRLTNRAESVIDDIFSRLSADPSLLPPFWYARLTNERLAETRLICDFISGMTDRYALNELERLGGRAPELTLSTL